MNDTSIVEVLVYGTKENCSSCVTLPSAVETASWLEAALLRKFGGQVKVRYIDICAPENEIDQVFSNRIIEENLWYPIVVIQGEILAEGNPKLRALYQYIEDLGVKPI
ncbi:DUF1462 family protein [Thermoactinomyces sp. DSM 45892]|uniref:DUF1462 family protein n=1 Tax=Thermoactinomyces sp. DSM 45892 TaxID=1882753 RepID=UPI00089A8E6F|nr:DUF1462 family protein [Thermoactinomyces sp. DSM 45892]SDZ35389.1 Disulfide oxidoreductase YuzD [Thermoactinomyces sp. DSM 45892]